jgi:3-deoxy-D-manno-octulosonic acid (KDO) 8-phosphate synthase
MFEKGRNTPSYETKTVRIDQAQSIPMLVRRQSLHYCLILSYDSRARSSSQSKYGPLIADAFCMLPHHFRELIFLDEIQLQ